MESPFGEEWKPTAVIKVGMGEEDIVNLSGIKAKWPCILVTRLGVTLKQTTIHEDSLATTGDEKTRAGDATSCAVECDLHC
jgi:hypothetical protein